MPTCLSPRSARWTLLVLVLLPLGFLPQVLLRRTPERFENQNVRVSQLVITAGVWPLAAEPLRELDLRATRIRQCYAPSSEPALSAAGLFTGSWPVVGRTLDEDQRVSRDTWSLVTGARAAGWRTAALLATPLATAAGLTGFEVLVEAPALGPEDLAAAALEAWREFGREPSFVWIHLADAGPDGAAVATLLAALEAAPDGLDARRRVETAILVTALGSDAALEEASDAAFRVPLYFLYPADLLAGRRSRGSYSLVDLASAVCDVTGIAPPAAGFDARRSIQGALQGRDLFEWCLMAAPEWHTLRNKRQRLTSAGSPADGVPLPVVWELAEPDQDRGFTRKAGPGGAGTALYLRTMRELLPRRDN